MIISLIFGTSPFPSFRGSFTIRVLLLAFRLRIFSVRDFCAIDDLVRCMRIQLLLAS